MARRLKLTKSEVVNANFQYLGAVCLRVEAEDAENTGADPNVFMYLRAPQNPYDGSTNDVFHAIASPADMAEYPAGQPSSNTRYPFYRLPYIELYFRAVSQLNDAWTTIVSEVGTLQHALDVLERLTPTEEVTVGDPDTDGSSSSSASA